jgi:hypothetical protein
MVGCWSCQGSSSSDVEIEEENIVVVVESSKNSNSAIITTTTTPSSSKSSLQLQQPQNSQHNTVGGSKSQNFYSYHKLDINATHVRIFAKFSYGGVDELAWKQKFVN